MDDLEDMMKRRLGVSILVALLLTVIAFSISSAAPAVTSRWVEVAASHSSEGRPAVAYSPASGTYLVVYEHDDHVRLRMYDSVGVPLTNTILDFGAGTYSPVVAYNSLHDLYGVALIADYSTHYSVNMYWVTGDAQELVDPAAGIQAYAAPSGDILMNPAIAFNNNDANDDFLIVWQQGNLGDWSIYGQRVTPTAPFSTVGARIDIALTTLTPAEDESFSAPDVAYNLNMNEYLVVFEYWTSDSAHTTATDILGRRIHNDGSGPGLSLVIDDGSCSQTSPTIAAYRLNHTTPYFVAYQDNFGLPTCDTDFSIRGIYLEQDGTLPPSPSYLNISANINTQEINPDILANEMIGGYIITWSKHSGANRDIYARYLDSSSGLIDPPFLVSGDNADARGNEDLPVVAGGAPTTFIAWQEDGWGGGGLDVIGRVWGYQTFIPLVGR